MALSPPVAATVETMDMLQAKGVFGGRGNPALT